MGASELKSAVGLDECTARSAGDLLTPIPALSHVPVGSRILSMLARTEYRRLRPSLDQVALPADTVLYTPGEIIRYIYFPNDAVVSLLFDVDERRTVEVAMEGNEGAVGLAVYLGGVKSCNLSIVRDAGTAMRLDVNALKRCANQSGHLQDLLRKFGVIPLHSPPYFPKFNGACEAGIGSLKTRALAQLYLNFGSLLATRYSLAPVALAWRAVRMRPRLVFTRTFVVALVKAAWSPFRQVRDHGTD